MMLIFILLPALALVWAGISVVLTHLGIDPGIVFWVLIGIGLIYGMIKSKKMRIAVPVTIVVILALAWFVPDALLALAGLIEKGIYLVVVLSYFLFYRGIGGNDEEEE